MNTSPNTHRHGIRAVSGLLLFLVAPAAWAQNSLLSIGKVRGDGVLAASAHTLGPGVSVASVANVPGPGHYTVTISAPGAFTGAQIDDFLAEVTIEGTPSNDKVAKTYIRSPKPDELSIEIRISDVEDSFNTDVPVARNARFFFAIYRIPSAFPDPGATKFLHALGKVNANGTLANGLGIDGVAVRSRRNGAGDYHLTLEKAGAYAGDVPDDYVIILTVERTGTEDQTILGFVGDTASDDQVVFVVRTDDAQMEDDDDNPFPEDATFFFNIYRIPPGADAGPAQSKLLVALARVGSNGQLYSPGRSFDGGNLSSVRNGEGYYTITITSPGAFAGKTADQFVLQLHLDQFALLVHDDFIGGEISLPDADTMTIRVRVNDLEKASASEGTPEDQSFYCLVFDAAAFFRPDLRIGAKKNPARQIGDDRFNADAAGQKIMVALSGNAKTRYWFTLENDGKLNDDIALRAGRAGKKIRVKVFRMTGGKRNVTAAIQSGVMVLDDVSPGALIRYEARAKCKNPNRRPAKTLRYLARSEFVASRLDANKVTLTPK